MLKSAAVDLVRLTYDDFVNFPDDGMRHELINGEHFVTPTPITRHQRIVGRLHASLFAFLEANRIGEVFLSPLDVVLSRYDVVEPDLLVVLADQVEIVTEKHVRGAPAIVVEVLSPGTRRRDRTLKRALYERVGVREYWMVDPDDDVVTIYRIGDDSVATATLERGKGVALASPLLPGWSIAVDALLAR